MTIRLLATLGAALLLSACSNLVYSEHPMFGDRTGSPLEFRPGLWAAPEPGCQFDPSKPFAEWPECASGAEFDERGSVDDQEWHSFVFAAGDPVIAQAGPALDDNKPFLYSYWAIGASRRDSEGRIIEFATWSVQCGPPSEPRTVRSLKHKTTATQHPLPGLRMSGENCLARRPEAVRRAAAASRQWGLTSSAHWVREKDRPQSESTIQSNPNVP